jgi:hypothetical protein
LERKPDGYLILKTRAKVKGPPIPYWNEGDVVITPLATIKKTVLDALLLKRVYFKKKD